MQISFFGDVWESGINHVVAVLIRPPTPSNNNRGGAPTISHGVRDTGGTLRLVGGKQRATTTASRIDDRRKADIGCPLRPRKRKSQDAGGTSVMCHWRRLGLRDHSLIADVTLSRD